MEDLLNNKEREVLPKRDIFTHFCRRFVDLSLSIPKLLTYIIFILIRGGGGGWKGVKSTSPLSPLPLEKINNKTLGRLKACQIFSVYKNWLYTFPENFRQKLYLFLNNWNFVNDDSMQMQKRGENMQKSLSTSFFNKISSCNPTSIKLYQ